MEIEYFVFCHASAIDGRGRPSLLCIFSEVSGSREPLSLTGEAVASIVFEPHERGATYNGKLDFVGADGELYAQTENAAMAVPAASDLTRFTMHFRVDLTGTILPVFGDYAVHLLIDEKVVKTAALHAACTKGD